MPRISTTLPLPPICLNSQSAPTLYVWAPPELFDPPQAATSKPAARIKTMAFGHLPTDIANLLSFSNRAQSPPGGWSLTASENPATATDGGNRLPPTREIVKGT